MSALATTLSLIVGATVADWATCIVAGMLVARGELAWPLAFVGCLAGIVAGDIIWILAGRLFGWSVADRWLTRWSRDQAALARWRSWIQQHAVAAVFVSRFSPGLQVPFHVINGLFCGSLWRLVPALFTAATLYVAVLLALTNTVADSLLRSLDERYTIPALLLIGLGAWALLRLLGRMVMAYVSSETR